MKTFKLFKPSMQGTAVQCLKAACKHLGMPYYASGQIERKDELNKLNVGETVVLHMGQGISYSFKRLS